METKTADKLDVYVRWMIRRDMTEVMAIERASFPNPWTESELLAYLKNHNCIGMVAEDQIGNVAGFMVYELLKNQLHVLNFAVDPKCRFHGIGRAMVDRLKSKLSQQRREELVVEVRDSNLDAHLFWRACGFTAIDVLRDHYEDTDEDAYRFIYLLEECDQ